MAHNPKEGGSPNISVSIKPFKIHLAVSKELEKLSKQWGKPSERLFSHFVSVLELVFLRSKENKEFMDLVEKSHKDIEIGGVDDIKSLF